MEDIMCVGFADCPCKRCRATRMAATAAHPNHGGISRSAYCGACRTADREAHRAPAGSAPSYLGVWEA